jgi:hypothetical protein
VIHVPVAAAWLLCAVLLLRLPSDDTWTAWLFGQGDLIQINSNGTQLQRVRPPRHENDYFVASAFSHDGTLFAYITLSRELDIARLRVYDTQSEQLRLNVEFPNVNYPPWSLMLRDSRNFSPDDRRLAIGYPNPAYSDWSIAIYDLETGELINTLDRSAVPTWYSRPSGTAPTIFQFTASAITFLPIDVWSSQDTSIPLAEWSANWHFETGQFSENCAFTYLEQGVFEPTGEVVEAAIHYELGYIPDTDIVTDGIYTLELYIPKMRGRQVFYQNRDFLPTGITFVQNGERLVVQGRVDLDKAGLSRLVLIERDGTLIDQLDVTGEVNVQATNNGFVYTSFYDVSGWVSDLIYVPTRNRAEPFEHQSVVWSSEPETYASVKWARSDVRAPLADFMPWGDRLSYLNNCPPNRG